LETTLKGASLQNGQSISKWKSSIQVDLKKKIISSCCNIASFN